MKISFLQRLFCVKKMKDLLRWKRHWKDWYQVKLEIDVNEARYKFFTKKKKPLPHSLPSTKDACYLHIEHANY